MSGIRLLVLIVAVAGWTPTLAQEATVQADATDGLVRESRTLHKKKLCRKYGICEGYGGYNGGYGGYQGYSGHQGYDGYGGYQGYPNQGIPINIAISQSQSSANEGGGGHANGYFPHNQQYNGGYPQHGYNQGYHQGYNGYHNQGYGGYRAGFDNGNFAQNSQFNGNYYSGGPSGGYGYQGPFGYQGHYDYRDNEEGYQYDEGERSASSGAVSVAQSSAVASVKS